MVALWVVLGLIVATFSVSTLGAAFSVIGLSALFSGAALAVIAMATSLEFAKFVLSAYLHQRWKNLNLVFRTYLLFAIVVLSMITSMGIFGFLSDAYQSASSTLEAENIKLETLKNQQNRNASEIARLNKNIDEIPATRISKKLKARAEAEPLIAELTKQSEVFEKQISEANLHILEVKQKVGPLIYIARVFKVDIDSVVKYLILILVCVFDPLAICLVIATSEALETRRRYKLNPNAAEFQNSTFSVPPAAPAEDAGVASAAGVGAAPGSVAAAAPAPAPGGFNPMSSDHPSEDIMQMKFADDKDRNSV